MNNQRDYFDQSIHRYPALSAINPPSRQKHEMEQLQQSLAILQGEKLLDFGCGSGRVTFWFLKRGYDVTAVDISKQSLEEVKRLYTKNRTSSWGTLKTYAAVPKNIKFDAIVGADILHHISMPDVLPRLYGALKSGGCVAFSEPNGRFPLWYLFLLLKRLPWSIEHGITGTTRGNLQKQLMQAGFRHVSIKSHGICSYRLMVTARA